jgi:high affinity Mn2+ porin
MTRTLIALAALALSTLVQAEEAESWSLHGQLTSVTQRHGQFRSPYEGANSLRSVEGSKTTQDATLFLGLRPWTGGELYLNPELDRGLGLSDTLGAAGFPSGAAYKVGHHSAYGRLQRAFLRQVLALGDAPGQPQAAGANQLAGPRPADKLTLTLGKFSAVDVFDGNAYAHDPRADFLNWSVIDAGAFDYAADAWGYTLGAAAELARGEWTGRLGLFALSREPNSTHLDRSFGQHQWVAEVEHRHRLGERPGVLRLLAFASRARMGSYDDAVAAGTPADASAVRGMRGKQGWSVNLEQELTADLGGFARFSRNDGRTEAFDFTDINRSLSAGLSMSGAAWGQAGHRLGLALALNSLSTPARRYFAAGGLGILVGDGRLDRYGSERIAEVFYALPLVTGVTLTLDLQRLHNPGYNTERGPVSVVGARLHAEM